MGTRDTPPSQVRHLAAASEPLKSYSEEELAQLWGCARGTLRRMRREGRGPPWIHVGRLVRYPETWVRAYMEANAEVGMTSATK